MCRRNTAGSDRLKITGVVLYGVFLVGLRSGSADRGWRLFGSSAVSYLPSSKLASVPVIYSDACGGSSYM